MDIQKLRKKLFSIIFESDTRDGRLFDQAVLILILISILTVIAETTSLYDAKYHHVFIVIEWFISILFTIEYLLRIWVSSKPRKYIFSFYGIIDLLAILPLYISLIFFQAKSMTVIRALRLLRVFRILKLGHFTRQSMVIARSIRQSMPKITVFFYFVVILVVVFGSIMYLVEGGVNEGFSSIPQSIYWAVVTLTTVGYGDVSPITPLGKFLSSLLMIAGYAIIAVPTGIITAEMGRTKAHDKNISICCRTCLSEDHDSDAVFCKKCGEKLN
ncbi:MAG TPA: ion transporter [Saprospirales bacterium]|nr:ion transporter [Saprospirales bacterium]